MFGTPERRMENETITFYVPVKTPLRLGLRVYASEPKILLPDVSTIKVFDDLRTQALNELTKTEQLFKNKPTFTSLDSITPKWGVIYNETKTKGSKGSSTSKGLVLPAWSPYTHFDFTEPLDAPCFVDLVLTAILITRSTISPRFGVVFLEKETSKKSVIDFDWPSAPTTSKEIEEIEDISAVDSGTMTLRDPAVKAKETADAKEYVRSLFRTADQARTTALKAMDEFFRRYSLSDNESEFSEWVEGEDADASSDEIESLPELPVAQKKYEQGY